MWEEAAAMSTRSLRLGVSAASGPDQPLIDRLARSFGTDPWAVMHRAFSGAVSRAANRLGAPTLPGGEVTLFSATWDRIVGRLTLGNAGLLFDSQVLRKKDPQVTIHALDQRELVDFRSDDSHLTIRFGGGVTTTRIARADVASPRAVPPEQARMELPPGSIEGGERFLEEIFRSPEYALLPELSYALGLAGATGQRYRPSLALHSFGMSAAGLLGVNPAVPGVSYIWKYPPGLRRIMHQRFFDENNPFGCWEPGSGPNLDLQPQCATPCEPYPNRDKQCFGMCGPHCDCWSWVCGDCCYHDFCADHDALFGQCEAADDPTALAACAASVGIIGFLVFGCDGGLF